MLLRVVRRLKKSASFQKVKAEVKAEKKGI
jgi:hypothetical protein